MDNKDIFKKVNMWMYRNARHIDLCLWQYFFENGKREAVVDALMKYQNPDGGFGHGLEADNLNPDSTPITTNHAIKILELIEFDDREHPVFQGIWNYLNSGKDREKYGWRFTVPSNDNHPHAPWWNFSEQTNREEYFGVSAELSSFILKYGNKENSLYQWVLGFTNQLFEQLISDTNLGDMGLEGYLLLADAVKDAQLPGYSVEDWMKLYKILAGKVNNAIEHDVEKWKYYTKRPSVFIHSRNSIFYQDNKEIVEKEVQFLKETLPEGDVWGITWTWFQNMEQYGKEFAVSENWWKGFRAIENMLFLREFG